MRKIVQKTVGGVRLVGTAHGMSVEPAGGSTSKLGILWLNSGFLPRSAVGDLYVKLADHLCRLGYLVFRFDLPGLGDSEGSLPADTQSLFAQLTRGAHGSAAAHLAAALCDEFHLDGVIFAGVCGGAVSSLFAACGEARHLCRGIIQMDPTFKLVPFMDSSRSERGARPSAKPRTAGSLYARFRVTFLQTKVGDRVHRGYAVFKPTIRRFKKALRKLQPTRLPENANSRLVAGWIDLLTGGVPMLTIMAGDKEKRTEKFDYLSYIDDKAQSAGHTVVWIHDTTHSFVEGSGIEATRHECEKWLAHHFSKR